MLQQPHYDYLLPLLSARQLKDWSKYYTQIGFGPDRNDKALALIAFMQSDGKKEFDDFLFYHPPTNVPELTAEEFGNEIRRLIPQQCKRKG